MAISSPEGPGTRLAFPSFKLGDHEGTFVYDGKDYEYSAKELK
jgi:hypothetical protein